MKQFHFVVNTVPVAQPRQRHRVITAKNGRTFAHNYTPAKDPVNAFKAAIQHEFSHRYPDAEPIVGPIELIIVAMFPRIKSHFRTGKRANELKPNAPNIHYVKPDGDNVEKAIKDALTKLAWRDDCQVADLIRRKRYGMTPKVEITIKEMNE